MRYLILALLLFSLTAKAEELTAWNCLDRAKYVSVDMKQLWDMVQPYPNSRARDGVYTSQDYAKEYYDIMRRSAARVDRTKGIFQELQDRWNYAYSWAVRYPWNNSGVWNTLELTQRDVQYLAQCY